MECPICEYPRVRPSFHLGDRFFSTTREKFLLYSCSSCGLLFQDPRTVQGRLMEFYPEGYWWKGEGRFSTLERVYREWVLGRDQLKFLLSIFPDPSARRLLDIGCGSGTLVKLARRAGFEAYGMEVSPGALEAADPECRPYLLQSSEEELLRQGQKFDVLTLFHSLEHLPEPFPYLKKIQKLLARPGALVVQVPNRASWQARILGRRWYGLDCPRHLFNYSEFALLHLLGRAGYRIHRIRHFSLRDNAAALVSSLFPFLDPVSQRVRLVRHSSPVQAFGLTLKEAIYFNLVMLAQPLAWLEALWRRGGTVTVYASMD